MPLRMHRGSNENNGYQLSYIIDYPKNFDKANKYPVIFYFHGMGMVRKGIQNLINSVPVRREYMTDDMPFIIVAPYCEEFTWIGCFEKLTAFTDYIIKQNYVDDKRIYIRNATVMFCIMNIIGNTSDTEGR